MKASTFSCTFFSGDPYVIVTSTPAGARILVDGEDTGDTTPAKLELGGMLGSDHQIEIRKDGFVPEIRQVYHYTSAYSSRLIDAATELELLNNPVYWTFGDFFLPFGVRWRYVPHELHVVLYEARMGPVQHDAEALPVEPR